MFNNHGRNNARRAAVERNNARAVTGRASASARAVSGVARPDCDTDTAELCAELVTARILPDLTFVSLTDARALRAHYSL